MRVQAPGLQEQARGPPAPGAEAGKWVGSHPSHSTQASSRPLQRVTTMGCGSLLGSPRSHACLLRGEKVPVLSLPESAPADQVVSGTPGWFSVTWGFSEWGRHGGPPACLAFRT